MVIDDEDTDTGAGSGVLSGFQVRKVSAESGSSYVQNER